MKLLSLPVRIVAKFMLKKEWTRLSKDLQKLVTNYCCKKNDIPIIMQKLLISGEDHRFFSHGGFDPIAIARAIWKTKVLKKREGASTIEQQIVRVVTGNYQKTLRRKIKEILLATLLSNCTNKKILPGLYLFIAYYGWKMNGYHQACIRLRLKGKELNLQQAASLVARLKYPEPQNAPPSRVLQISHRSSHLINLYKKHSLTNVYEGINNYDPIYTLKSSPRPKSRVSTSL